MRQGLKATAGIASAAALVPIRLGHGEVVMPVRALASVEVQFFRLFAMAVRDRSSRAYPAGGLC